MSDERQGIDWHKLEERRPSADSPAGVVRADTEERGEHWHGCPRLYYAEEGWEWVGGVPDGVEDGWFCQDLAELGPVAADEDGGAGGRIEVWASDGHAVLSWQGDETLSLEQARHFRALLDQAIAVLEAYQPPAWMLDPEQLHKRKVEAEEESYRRAAAACPACSQESTP